MNEAPTNLVPLQYSSTHCTVSSSPQGMLTAISFYFDDDDDCQSAAWNVYTTDGSPTTMICHGLSPVSWASSKIFGNTPVGTYPNMDTPNEKHQTKNLRTLSISQGNFQCGGIHPCIPGLDSMAIGFDITTGDMKLPAVQWTFKDAKSWHSPFTGITYAVPDQIALSTSSSSAKREKVYNSYASYVTNSTEAYSSGWDGYFFQFGTEEQTVRRAFDKTESIVAVAEELYISHSMQLDDYSASNELLYAMNQLPATYDQEIYFNFLAYWGTHISTSASYGGKAKLFSFVDQEWFMSSTEDQIQSSVGIQFNNWKLGAGWGNTATDSTVQFSKESFQWISFSGGDASLALTSQWSEWINSTHFAPAQINKELVQISELCSNPTIQANLVQAITNYYEEANTVAMPLPVYLGTKIVYSYDGSGPLMYTSYVTFCIWSHGLGWVDTTYFATSGQKLIPEMQVPVGYQKPRITDRSYKRIYPDSTGTYYCPSDKFLIGLGTITNSPSCETDCNTAVSDNKSYLGSYMDCASLALE